MFQIFVFFCFFYFIVGAGTEVGSVLRRDRDRETERDRERHRETETERQRQRETEGDRAANPQYRYVILKVNGRIQLFH